MNIPERTCRCGVVFKPAKPHQLYHNSACAHDGEIERQRKRRRDSKRTFTPRACDKCGVEFTPHRVDQINCRTDCKGKNDRGPAAIIAADGPRPARTVAADVARPARHVADSTADRVLATGLYLGGLGDEVALLGKTKGIVGALEAQLRAAISDDALWPESLPGRIALVLALIKNPALIPVGRWRHAYEKRRPAGKQWKPSATLIRAGIGVPGLKL